MDVTAFYPSMSLDEIVKSIKWLIVIVNNDLIIENIHWFKVGIYLAVMMTPEEITEEGLTNVILKRRGLRLRRITVNYLRHKRNEDKWIPARKPGVRQQRKITTGFMLRYDEMYKNNV